MVNESRNALDSWEQRLATKQLQNKSYRCQTLTELEKLRRVRRGGAQAVARRIDQGFAQGIREP